ncbi:MAG: hypothetical protein ACFFCW_25265 [Candidatus Hodarchaeota archaeon]
MPEDAFELDADSDAFAPAEDFIKYSLETTDISSPILKAMKLYQRELDFHINDSSKEGFVEADINRLRFIKAHSFGEEKSNHYMTRLSEIAEDHPFMPLSSLAYYYWAQELYDQGDYAEALKIAKNGEAQHADSYWGKMCQPLIAQIEAKEMILKSINSATPSCSEVILDYRNISEIHLQVVEDQGDCFLYEHYGLPDYISDDKFKQLIESTPVKSWSVALEPTIDYKTRSHTITLPSLEPGYYRLIASWQQDFAEQENATRIVSFWVTGITMVTERINGETIGFIRNAHSGAPLEGAEVKGFYKIQTDLIRRWVQSIRMKMVPLSSLMIIKYGVCCTLNMKGMNWWIK